MNNKISIIVVLLFSSQLALSIETSTACPNMNQISTTQAPTTNQFYNSNGQYAGSSQTVNGGTSYYSNGKYQGQSTTGSSFYYNKQGQLQLINQVP